jgi:hypothetical protein
VTGLTALGGAGSPCAQADGAPAIGEGESRRRERKRGCKGVSCRWTPEIRRRSGRGGRSGDPATPQSGEHPDAQPACGRSGGQGRGDRDRCTKSAEWPDRDKHGESREARMAVIAKAAGVQPVCGEVLRSQVEAEAVVGSDQPDWRHPPARRGRRPGRKKRSVEELAPRGAGERRRRVLRPGLRPAFRGAKFPTGDEQDAHHGAGGVGAAHNGGQATCDNRSRGA